jgi:hypothetical protein
MEVDSAEERAPSRASATRPDMAAPSTRGADAPTGEDRGVEARAPEAPGAEIPGGTEATAAIPGQRGGETAPPAGKRPRRFRRVLLVVAIVLAVLCAGGGIIAAFAYDRATRIDRSTPSVVVQHYVYAMFDDRDDKRARLYECKNLAEDGFRDLLADLIDREGRFDIKILVAPAHYETSTGRVSSNVLVDLNIDVPEEDERLSRSTQRFSVDLRKEDGWRVCATRRVT